MRSARSSSRPRSAGSARCRTWRTRGGSGPPTGQGSSPGRDCRSTAAWACDRGPPGSQLILPGKGALMSTDKPVVVYGASGYTGQLICEYLREFNVPFVAAGRDKARISEALDRVPGIGTVPHEVIEVEHAVGPLTELLAGAKVVLNTVGPFARHGSEEV